MMSNLLYKQLCRMLSQGALSKRSIFLTAFGLRDNNPGYDLTAAEVTSAASHSALGEQINLLHSDEPPIPVYKPRSGEKTEQKRARLLYQSRKRGMLENGLLMSAFADRYLFNFDGEELQAYDKLINEPSNDWEIYYWVAGVRPVPQEFQSKVLDKLIQFARNEKKEMRIRQPDLKETFFTSDVHD
ncbi:succinate dehydrogenase assembly factor 2, mitochondrial-like [Paramacrobiotus metropolitanus]|uniref:succinate dehydrogenase assembly factor 2, mitochondrial-like n=1 Tax=Paramacrobiotus metropolitanus TaxID=2943436 RepID=UPI002445819E|nr:succinate dehydrogenase assembly factor 2, mitochondrial-like [Paramacrobiotus metropolitanus]XP_055328526.1 succinate dehydrogenase assembly factor 2, mitochondrial-like [Paramacrobiotus metropolitanus]